MDEFEVGMERLGTPQRIGLCLCFHKPMAGTAANLDLLSLLRDHGRRQTHHWSRQVDHDFVLSAALGRGELTIDIGGTSRQNRNNQPKPQENHCLPHGPSTGIAQNPRG